MPTPTYSFGKGSGELENNKWLKSGMETHGSIVLINHTCPDGVSLGIVKNNTSVTHGGEHAEDVAIRTIKASGLLVTSPSVNTIILSVSKSPCSSTYGTSNKPVGCTEELIKFQNNSYNCPTTGNEYIFKLIVIARGIYKQSPGSHDAMDMLTANGIQVATDVHRKKDGSPAKKEYAMEID